MIMRRMIKSTKVFQGTKKMKTLYCGKYRKFEKPKISCLLKEILVFFTCSKCKNEDEKIFRKKKN